MMKLFRGVTRTDSFLFNRIYGLSGHKFLDHFFYIVSRIGDGWVYAGLIILYIIFKTSEALRLLPAFVAAFVVEGSIYFLVKKNVKRIRPFVKFDDVDSLIMPPDEFSFPSGHTAAAAVFSTFVLYIFPWLSPAGIIYVGLIGFSRIYNGVHYPGDVLAGAALGTVISKVSIAVFY